MFNNFVISLISYYVKIPCKYHFDPELVEGEESLICENEQI